jgi:hypothetical protein
MEETEEVGSGFADARVRTGSPRFRLRQSPLAQNPTLHDVVPTFSV